MRLRWWQYPSTFSSIGGTLQRNPLGGGRIRATALSLISQIFPQSEQDCQSQCFFLDPKEKGQEKYMIVFAYFTIIFSVKLPLPGCEVFTYVPT